MKAIIFTLMMIQAFGISYNSTPTISITNSYDDILVDGQLYFEYDIDENVLVTNNYKAVDETIEIGDHFHLLNALIIMELEPAIAQRAINHSEFTSTELRDLYYSEEYIDTFEGALYMGNNEYFSSQFVSYSAIEILNALEGYKAYFSFDQDSEYPMHTVTSTPIQLSLFLNQIGQGTLFACEENVQYLKNLMTIDFDNQSLLEVFIISSGNTTDLYINLGVVNDIRGVEMHYFQEYISSNEPNGLTRAISNNYEAMHLNDRDFALGYFGE